MRRSMFLLAACVAVAGSCRPSGGRLTDTECEELVAHIEKVVPSGRAQEAIDKCIAGQTWNRVGYECAMKAGFRAAISSCLMKQR